MLNLRSRPACKILSTPRNYVPPTGVYERSVRAQAGSMKQKTQVFPSPPPRPAAAGAAVAQPQRYYS
ncbi:unnamed protein product [Merluccius merluccius]